ncbi:MAG: hypothetical protein A3E25_13510 [Burkholderiales bacterium RIFCSPHIGHO2_12_FULL_69_20]|nr:MAG: hypothetical protein A3E25_13510 [Burkholderiales bacterium RIFCSPHIGHO2_12_FULL_69_20]
MTDPTAAFAKMVPGFDFLQGLVKNAGAAMPSVGQWVAPTLDPQELEKRINDLRTVQFWLEQNARLLGTTIQALEVQRMTLSTLKTMNVSFGDLTESLKIRMPERAPERAPEPEVEAAPAPAPAPRQPSASEPAPTVPAGVVDPMQWWGALTQQFTQLAANAMKDSTGDAAKHLAGAMVQQGLDAAGETFKKAAGMPVAVAKGAASAAQKMAGAAVKAGTRTAAKSATKPRAAAKRSTGKAR